MKYIIYKKRYKDNMIYNIYEMKNDKQTKTSSQPIITMTKTNYQKALDYFGLDGKDAKQIAKRFNFTPTIKIKVKGKPERLQPIKDPTRQNYQDKVREEVIRRWKVETKEYQGKFKYKFQVYDKRTKKVNTINREILVKGTKDTLLLNALAEFERLKNKYNRESDADLSSFEMEDDPYEKVAIEEGKGILVVNGSVTTTISGGKRKVGKRGHKANMKMRFAGNHLLLAGKESQEWDRKQGTCVFDYLYHRFNGVTGYKKELGPEYRKKKITREEAYEWLNDLFKSNEIDEQNPLEQGVSTQQLEKFCDYFNVAMYAFDKDDELIEWYRPNVVTEFENEEEETNEKKQRYKTALFFTYYNQHFNPIEDETEKNKKQGTAIGKATCKSIKSNDVEGYKAKADETKRKVIAPDLEHYEAEQKKLEERNYPISLGNKIAIDMLRENKWVLPTMKNNAIDVDENTIIRIKYDDKIILTEPIQERNRDGIKVNKLVKKYLEEYCDREYQGETYIGIMNEIWNSMYPFSIRDAPFNSKPNVEVLTALNADKVKYRTHLGLIKEEYLKYVEKDENGQRLISKLLKEGKAIATDISKCYADCIYNQRENFIVFSGKESIELFDGKPLTLGLYFIETDDMTLFHKSNWYSREIIYTARGEGINFTITHQIRCLEPDWKWERYDYDEEGKETSSIKLSNRNLFKNFCDSVIELTEMDENFDLTKLILNGLTGYLGKTHNKQNKAMISTNLQDIWEDWLIPEVSENPDAKVFLNPIQDGDDKLYLYGWETESELVTNCLPMYIQILDWANVALFDMIKEVGGECIYRKTDAIVSIGGKLPTENTIQYPCNFTETFGKYRIEPNAENYFYETLANPYRAVLTPKLIDDWNWYDFNNSNDWKFILEKAKEKGGMLVSGRAGTGKSFIVKKGIEEGIIPDDPKTRLAPTNRAARNINGTTIHKALAVNNNGKSNPKSMMYYANKEFVIVDEISMISSNIWNYLTRLKQTYPHLIFILIGDYRQCPPIEEGKEIDYFNHSYTKYLVNSNRCELTTAQRYDMPLWNWLEEFYEQGEVGDDICKKKLTIDNILYRKNICYLNKTRKRINQDCMSYLISQKSYNPICLSVDEKILKDNSYADTAYLYVGLPVMAVKNNCELEIINSEEFWVKEVKANESVLVLYRDEDETDEIVVDFKLFHKNFVVNYASTTHKSQGATIEKGINIWDWWAMERDRKLGYTAVSRAKKCEQVWIADDSKVEEEEEYFDPPDDDY